MRLFALPVLLAASAAAFPEAPARILDLVPAQAEAVAYYPRPQRLEQRWSAITGLFGKKEGLLDLKGQTGLDFSRVGAGPLAKISLPKGTAGENWVWLLPAPQPKSLLQGVNPKVEGKGWSWAAPQPVSKAAGKEAVKGAKAPAPGRLHGAVHKGFLLVAHDPEALAAVQKAGGALAAELAPFAAWMEGHDIALVATRLGVQRAAQEAGGAFKDKPAEAGKAEDPESAAPKAPKPPKRLQSKLEGWMEQAKVSVHHVLASLDLGEEGGIRFEARALLSKDSPLAKELDALPPASGNPLAGLPTAGFALAMGGQWNTLFDIQAALVEDLDKDGKVQAATKDRLQKAWQAQSDQIRTWAAVLGAPAPGQPFLGGLSSLIRVADSRAYLAAAEEASKAQQAFFGELGMPAAVQYVKDPIPGVPSSTVSTRLPAKTGTPEAQPDPAMGMLLGGDSLQVSTAALDEHRLLVVVGPPEQLKGRLEEARKAPDQLPSSIAGVAPDLGAGHRFALYLDLRGVRDFVEPLAGMFMGPEPKPFPAFAAVPAVGLALALGPEALELRGSVRGETLRAAAQFFKAVEAMFPKEKKGEKAQEK